MTPKLNIVFFGSFNEYSASLLHRLYKQPKFHLQAIVTTPPAPRGRHLALSPNPVQVFADHNHLPCFTPEVLDDAVFKSVSAHLPRPDFLVVAGYAKLLPPSWLAWPQIMPVNFHPSLLPEYPGRCPAEWTILNGETETGVTLIKMNPKFDAGEIIARQTLSIDPDDTRLTLYAKLYDLGADLLIKTLPEIIAGNFTLTPQNPGSQSIVYARQITRRDGFVPYSEFLAAITNPAGPDMPAVSTKFRAFAGWPGVWTLSPQNQRLKLIALKPRILIQPEGKKPMPPAQLPL